MEKHSGTNETPGVVAHGLLRLQREAVCVLRVRTAIRTGPSGGGNTGAGTTEQAVVTMLGLSP